MTKDEKIQYLLHRLERMGENYNALSYDEKQDYKNCQKQFLKLTRPNVSNTIKE